MKNIIINTVIALAIAACFWWGFYVGIERQEIVECYKSERICEQYYDVHKGDCWECKHMDWCKRQGII